MSIRKIPHEGHYRYKCTNSDRVFVKFMGGFSWPEKGQHSYICVFGQVAKDVDDEFRGCLVMVEEERENSMIGLARLIKNFEKHYVDTIRFWWTPYEGEYGPHFEVLYKICKQNGFTLKCTNPTIPNNLQVCVDILQAELKENSIRTLIDGPLDKMAPSFSKINIADSPEIHKYQPLLVSARVVYEFPAIQERIEEDRPKDGWAEGFKDKEAPVDWMAM